MILDANPLDPVAWTTPDRTWTVAEGAPVPRPRRPDIPGSPSAAPS